MKQFLVERWFLILLVLALGTGTFCAEPLRPVSSLRVLPKCVVAAVLFAMSLPLEARAMYRSLRQPGPPLLASLVNLGLLPLLAWSVAWLLRGDTAVGLLVAATTPCTLASASVWTRRAGGNDAVAILVTLLTNSVCFIVTPLWLVALTGRTVDSTELSFSRMSTELGLLVVLPMAAAQMLRLCGSLAAAATQHRMALGVIAQCGVLMIVFLGAIRTGLSLQGETQRGVLVWDLLSMLLAVVVVHVVALYAGIGLARLCRFSRADQIAVGFAGSQKTLMVGLLVAISLQVTILPMVAYHVSQLFVDTLIADRFRKAGGEPVAGYTTRSRVWVV